MRKVTRGIKAIVETWATAFSTRGASASMKGSTLWKFIWGEVKAIIKINKNEKIGNSNSTIMANESKPFLIANTLSRINSAFTNRIGVSGIMMEVINLPTSYSTIDDARKLNKMNNREAMVPRTLPKARRDNST
ncbi:hypothetical protein D3C81_1903510 [compost metagenome]